MANVRNGTITDPTLQNALAFGNKPVIQIINPDTFPDSEIFFYQEPQNIDTITASELDQANDGNTLIVVEEGFVVDTKGNIYILRKDENDFWVLLFSGDELQLDNSPDGTKVKLTIPAYIAYLKTLINLLEKVTYYLKLTSRLHKESVQDAVDIVQTKRIDFIETATHDIDLSGIFSSVIVFLIFETGLLGLIMAEAAAFVNQVSSNTLMQKAMNALFSVLGKNSGKNTTQSEINILEQEITKLQSESRSLTDKALSDLAAVNKIESQEEFLKASGAAKLILSNSQDISAKKKAAADLKEKLGERVKDESVKVGKEEVDRLTGIVKKKAAGNVSTIKDLTKGVTSAEIKLHSGQPSESPEKADPVPLDVYLKGNIQSIYDGPVTLFEKMILLTRDLLTNAETGGISSEEIAESHFKILKILPSPIDLSFVAEDYETSSFNAEFSYSLAKDIQTKEYEFFIWCLLLSPKIKEFVDTTLIRGKAEAAAASNFSQDARDLLKKPTIYNIIDIKDNTAEYLSIRFSLVNDKKEMATIISDGLKKVDNTIDEVDIRLKKIDIEKYKAVYSARVKKSIP